ncbi:uncharacterized protein M421DRAFT_4987 [Didymella exigua CBS 183.55]|uniref:Uncharacterized protein n=1 Tax=Didymella exigua CBS 183.55 TaxID=1150837 RepID=A0A6A5RJF9_9PLEO|nr:uncharacterized protein M421DRAFT_4987 [Didymella exigua CBS 183.55]KAF1928515.1 hypothetical protein M421DRAFT_4987 [Didymella exigua CBS 183.55]
MARINPHRDTTVEEVDNAPFNLLQSPLLRLPGELRNRIFALAFDTADLQQLWYENTPPRRVANTGRPLSQTCTKVRKEIEHLHDSYTKLRILEGYASVHQIFHPIGE